MNKPCRECNRLPGEMHAIWCTRFGEVSVKQNYYIEREGRQMGLEDRVRVRRMLGKEQSVENDAILHEIDASTFTFPVLRLKIWAFIHRYGWPEVLR